MRQLRPRKSRPSYTTLDDNQNEAGHSSVRIEGSDSESDFEPVTGKEKMEVEEDELVVTDDEEPTIKNRPVRRKSAKATVASKGSQRAKPSGKKKSNPEDGVGKSASRGSKRLSYALPVPVVYHRHRAVPLFSRSRRVERLASPPTLFSPDSVILTTASTTSQKVTDRVNKSWACNVGPGPVWELLEDRGWFKEAETAGIDVDFEAKRRPRVYSDICVRDGWQALSKEDAAAYLPTDDIIMEDGSFRQSPPINCYFGPIKSQTRREVHVFDTFPMSEYSPENNAHILNAGAPVWGIDWCPIHSEDRAGRSYKKYLAIAPFPSASYSPDIGRKVPANACIQIWSFAHKVSAKTKAEVRHMKCEMVLCLTTGPAYDLKWCPLPSHDLTGDKNRPRTLGLLSGTFGDGSFAIFVVPDPGDINSPHHPGSPVYVRLPQPILRVDLEETSCWSVDWANSSLVAIGTTNGSIAVYNIGSTLRLAAEANHPPITDHLPTHYLSVHQSAVRAVAWIRTPPSWPSGQPRLDQDPTVIASAGYDGVECLTDIREGRGAIMNRTRDVINAIAYSPFSGGLITVDENTVKTYSASPSMLGRGHFLFEPQGPIWSVHACDYHPQLAVGAADGSCTTTNMLRSTRRGGSAPFFIHKVFQMDYNRHTKEFRMYDQFLPQETIDRPSAIRAAKGKGKENDTPNSSLPATTGAWPQQVGVHRVVWNNGNGLASSTLLAAATASGLCRIDVLGGRWIRDRLPYGSIENIRMENGVGVEEDENLMASDGPEGDEDEEGELDAEGEDEGEIDN